MCLRDECFRPLSHYTERLQGTQAHYRVPRSFDDGDAGNLPRQVVFVLSRASRDNSFALPQIFNKNTFLRKTTP